MDISQAQRNLTELVTKLEPLQHALGQAGKKVALDVVDKDLGRDRVFSGFVRKVRLNAGYDLGNPVVLNLRPAGLFVLADKGRRRTKKIVPKKKSGKQALLTPRGPRASSTSKKSRGLNTIRTIEQKLDSGKELITAVEYEWSKIAKRVL